MATITLQQRFENSCEEFFQKPAYKSFETCMRDGELQDKIYKCADGFFALFQWWGSSVDAHPDVMTALAGGREAARATRDFAGMFAIFGGAFRAIGSNLVSISRLVTALLSDAETPNPVPLKKKKVENLNVNNNAAVSGVNDVYGLKYSEVAKGRWEMIFALITEIGKLIANAAFVLAFGPSRVCGNLIKFCKVETKTTHKLASWFPDLMLINHSAGLVAGISELFFTSRAAARAENANNVNNDKVAEIQADFNIKSWKISATILLKALEVIHSVIGKLHRRHVISKVPPIVQIPLGLIIGILSIYTVAIRLTADKH